MNKIALLMSTLVFIVSGIGQANVSAEQQEIVQVLKQGKLVVEHGKTKSQGTEVKKASPSIHSKSNKSYQWVGIFNDYGIIIRPVSSEFIGKYYLGEPFTWKALRKSFVTICEDDSDKVVADFKYHVVKNRTTITDSSIGREIGYTSIGINIIEHLYEGGVYSINIRPDLKAQSNNGICEDRIVGGPLIYKIVPIDNQHNLLTLGQLGPDKSFMEIRAFHGKLLKKDEARFTMTNKGPRPFSELDIEKPPGLSPVTLFSITALPFLLLGSYCFLIGYYSSLGISLKVLPPYTTLKDYFYYNISILFDWKTLIFISIGFLIYFVIAFLDTYLTLLIGFWSEPVEPGQLKGHSVLGIDISLWSLIWIIITVSVCMLFYFLWMRKWLPQNKTKYFALYPLASFLYLFLLPYGFDIRPREGLDTGNMIVNNTGILFNVLFWMYLRGIQEGTLLTKRAKNSLSTITILRQEQLQSINKVILGHLKDYLICFDADSDEIAIISTKDIVEITPHRRQD